MGVFGGFRVQLGNPNRTPRTDLRVGLGNLNVTTIISRSTVFYHRRSIKECILNESICLGLSKTPADGWFADQVLLGVVRPS
jgi:hypothetical protein